MTDPILIRARELAAGSLPKDIPDTLGRVHPNVLRRAILAGHCDRGRIVTDWIAQAEVEALRNRPEAVE